MAKQPVSQWIADQRKARGWKAEDVARRLREMGYEAEDATYRTWEASRSPRPATLRALEQLFGMPAPHDAQASPDLSALLARLDRQAEVIDRLAAAIEGLAKGHAELVGAYGTALAELRSEPADDPASASRAGTRP